MDGFLNANNSNNKDLIEWNTRRSDEQDVVMTSILGFHDCLKSLHLKKCPSPRGGHTFRSQVKVVGV